MSSKNKFFHKKNIDPKDANITGLTAVNITDRNLITGDDKGNIVTYEFSQSGNLIEVKSVLLNPKAKVDKIIIHPSKNNAFVLIGGDVYYANLPSLKKTTPIFKSKDIVNVFVNNDDKGSENYLLILNKKKKLKLYEFSMQQDKPVANEIKMKKDFVLEDIPNCAIWTEKNYFVYSIYDEKDKKGSSNWLNFDTGVQKNDDFPGVVEIIKLGEKVGISSSSYTLFMREGASYTYSMLLHESGDFQNYAEFKNHLFALYNKKIGIFKAGTQQYDFVESITLDENENGKFMVASNMKLVVITESNKVFHFLDFQERPYTEQIKILIDQKEYDKALEKLIENTSETDPKRKEKIENVFLDCAWACLEGDKKDYEKSIRYLSLTNFNPFEFIYMFYDSLNVTIIHKEKAKEILDRRKENQLFGLSAEEKEQKNAFDFLIKILKMKRDYILEKYIKSNKSDKSDRSAEIEAKKLKFNSSERSKINLSEPETEIAIRDIFYAINSTLVKSMIKIKADPKEIEAVLDNETINNSKFEDFEEEDFFKDEKNKNLDETKFTLSYITEKEGNDYESALEQWEKFGRSNNRAYSVIGKDRTKKIFYKFKETKNTERVTKEKLFRKYIQWLLEKYQTEAFEVVIKTELVSNKVFLEDIIPDFNINRKDGKTEDVKEKFLEYCNNNQRTENYQTMLLQLYADKMFKLAGQEKAPEKMEGEIKRYYDSFMNIIQSEDSVYNKKTILDYIEKTWLKEPRIYLFSQLNEHDKALKELYKLSKVNQSFKEINEFCQKNLSSHHEIYENYYELLSGDVKQCQDNIDKNIEKIQAIKNEINHKDSKLLENEKLKKEEEIKKLQEEIKEFEGSKEPFEKEMKNVLKNHGKIEELDPIKALEFANDHWNVCDNNEFFDYLMNVVKDYTISGNKYKITKNLSEIGLIYKEKEAYDFKKKSVTIDSEKTCNLCKKKIGSTIFVVYPNLKVYHSKCATNSNIDPSNGEDFSKKKYVE